MGWYCLLLVLYKDLHLCQIRISSLLEPITKEHALHKVLLPGDVV